ncbi:ATP-dependent zinc protease family protein [Nitrosomonas supralitoralis]|uniref:ATP-dependent zinc protease n=1 Tax=Nitrosomonas supralitoralis TaxID=2116706 RepID=A0A2P7NUU7_9PROT|nr:RimK/LysX family protein [Nitrosomonas supralitoralis]PSJ17209.1 ATP-dependent zinc protease [Nitrosomonas supralitoralis]
MKSQKTNLFYFIFLFIGTVTFFASTPVIANKSVYGYLEPVTLTPDKITLTAKLDTGAETASISAKDIQLYEKKGEEYVKFKVSHPNLEQTLHYNLPIVRHSKIKRRAIDGINNKKFHSRPVVNIEIYFDGKPHKIMVNLIDRSNFSTPMLLGRKALEKVDAIVDSTVANTLLSKNERY